MARSNFAPGATFGRLYGLFRGLNPTGNLRRFGSNFKSAAGIPQDAQLWTKAGGLQLGNLPIQAPSSWAPTAGAAGLDTASGFGGLGDIYNFAADSKFANLNGLSRQGVLDALAANPTAPKGISPEQLSNLKALGDVTETPGAVTPGKGVSLGKIANIANVAMQLGQAGYGLYQNAGTSEDIQDLIHDIRSLKISNPMYASNLTPDQKELLRSLDSTSEADFGDITGGVVSGLPSTLLSTGMGFLAGGIPGAVIAGLGGLANSGISGYNQGQQERMAELMGLYDALQAGYDEWRMMRRPTGLYNANLQSRYYNQLY